MDTKGTGAEPILPVGLIRFFYILLAQMDEEMIEAIVHKSRLQSYLRGERDEKQWERARALAAKVRF